MSEETGSRSREVNTHVPSLTDGRAARHTIRWWDERQFKSSSLANMRRPLSAKTSSLGVTLTKLAVESQLEWLFREQSTEDYGIDAHLEIVRDNVVDGRLLALQIKSGHSFFSEKAHGGWWFRPDAQHVHYWVNHSLPVIVVLCDTATRICYWQLVNMTTLERTSDVGWKMLIPEVQKLDEDSRLRLEEAASADPYVLRLRNLQLSRTWMIMLANGERLVIEVEEWINKSSGRGAIKLGVVGPDGLAPDVRANWAIRLPGSEFHSAIPNLFSWAELNLHQETYEAADRERYESECVGYDSNDRQYQSMSFDEWALNQNLEMDAYRPYLQLMGEVEYTMLELTLNDLGKAFLTVDQFASQSR